MKNIQNNICRIEITFIKHNLKREKLYGFTHFRKPRTPNDNLIPQDKKKHTIQWKSNSGTSGSANLLVPSTESYRTVYVLFRTRKAQVSNVLIRRSHSINMNSNSITWNHFIHKMITWELPWNSCHRIIFEIHVQNSPSSTKVSWIIEQCTVPYLGNWTFQHVLSAITFGTSMCAGVI